MTKEEFDAWYREGSHSHMCFKNEAGQHIQIRSDPLSRSSLLPSVSLPPILSPIVLNRVSPPPVRLTATRTLYPNVPRVADLLHRNRVIKEATDALNACLEENHLRVAQKFKIGLGAKSNRKALPSLMANVSLKLPLDRCCVYSICLLKF